MDREDYLSDTAHLYTIEGEISRGIFGRFFRLCPVKFAKAYSGKIPEEAREEALRENPRLQITNARDLGTAF